MWTQQSHSRKQSFPYVYVGKKYLSWSFPSVPMINHHGISPFHAWISLSLYASIWESLQNEFLEAFTKFRWARGALVPSHIDPVGTVPDLPALQAMRYNAWPYLYYPTTMENTSGVHSISLHDCKFRNNRTLDDTQPQGSKSLIPSTYCVSDLWWSKAPKGSFPGWPTLIQTQ